MGIMTKIAQIAQLLEDELRWFGRVVSARLQARSGASSSSVLEIAPPDLSTMGIGMGAMESEYAAFVRHYQLSFAERLAVVLGLVPHLRPQLLEALYSRDPATD